MQDPHHSTPCSFDRDLSIKKKPENEDCKQVSLRSGGRSRCLLGSSGLRLLGCLFGGRFLRDGSLGWTFGHPT